MRHQFKIPALVLAASLAAGATTASAAPQFAGHSFGTAQTGVEAAWEHGRGGGWRDDDHHGRQRVYYDEPVYRDTRVWRGDNGRYYCRKKDGTVGTIIGGAVGALLGRELDGGYNRSTGTILGAAGGALLGRHVARNGGRCR